MWVLRRKVGSSRSCTPTLVAALQLFLLGLVLGWVLVLQQRWYVCGSRDCVPGSGSEECDGCCSVVSKRGDDVAHHFFSAGLDNALTRPHHDTSTGTTSTFCLNQSLYHLIKQGHFLNKPPHRHLGHLARQLHPDFTVTATTDMRWTLVCVRRQAAATRDMSVALHRSLSILIYGYSLFHFLLSHRSVPNRFSDFPQKWKYQGDFSLNLEISKSAEMPGMSARVRSHFTRSELSSNQMAHAGGPHTRDHPAKGQTARQWRSLKDLLWFSS